MDELQTHVVVFLLVVVEGMLPSAPKGWVGAAMGCLHAALRRISPCVGEEEEEEG